MQRILPATGRHALFDTAHTRRIEQYALAALPAHTLMRRAGLAVTRLALAVAPHAERIWVCAGAGNNGGDGLEAAIHLLRAGKQVELTLLGGTSPMPADAADALARAQAAGVSINQRALPALEPRDLAIDALLGIGASGTPRGAVAESIRSLNSLRAPGAFTCPVLAVDLPSGLQADTGQPAGEPCVVATHTLSLLTLKPGLFTGAGRDHAGTVWLDVLGTDTSAEAPEAWLIGSRSIDATAPSPRQHAQHKGSFGDVAVVGGAEGMTGAALLAAHAAHAAGAGRTFVALLDAREPAGASALSADPTRPELMFRRAWWNSPPEVLAQTLVVCGCGGGEAVRAVLPRLLSHVRRMVLDADALNAIAADAALQQLLRARTGRGFQTVLTPHPLEAARLLACGTAEVQAHRLKAAQRLADGFGCVVVLKGSGSVTAAPGCVPHINATGNASLASAGTGDVLAGWLGGRWVSHTASAQTPPSQAPRAGPQANSLGAAFEAAFQAAVLAVAEHGAAADPMQPGSLRAADLVEMLHRRLRAGC